MKPWAAALVCAAAGLLVGGYGTVLIERVPASRTISGSFGELTRHPLGECPRCAAGLRTALTDNGRRAWAGPSEP